MKHTIDVALFAIGLAILLLVVMRLAPQSVVTAQALPPQLAPFAAPQVLTNPVTGQPLVGFQVNSQFDVEAICLGDYWLITTKTPADIFMSCQTNPTQTPTSVNTWTPTPSPTDTPQPTLTPFIPTLTETPVPQPTDTPTKLPDTPTPAFPLGTPTPTATVLVPPSGTPANTATPTPSVQPPTIIISPSLTYQTIIGWQATGIGPVNDANYPVYRDALFASAEDLGINSIRLEVVKVAGQPSFNLAAMDVQIDGGLLTYRTLFASHGKRLLIDLCVSGGGFAYKNYGVNNSTDFASAMVALYAHMQSRYGFVPDTFEILEPDTFGWYSNLGTPVGPGSIGAIYAATGNALLSAGYMPSIIATSDSRTDIFLLRFPQLWADPNHPADRVANRANVKVASFHVYDLPVSDAALVNIATVGAVDGVQTAMLEHIGSDYRELHRLLKLANVSLYQQYTLAFPTTDNGAQYFVPSGITYTLGSRTKLLYQYMHYIQPDAVRIGAIGTSAADPVAFTNPNGKVTVVISATVGTFSVGGLPADTYGISYSTSTQYNVSLSDVVLGAGQLLNTSIPSAGALTIYGK